MFADPLAVTINAVVKNLTRINQDNYSSEWYLREASGEYTLKIRHSTYLAKDRNNIRIDRHNVELVHTIFPVAPSTIPTIRKYYNVFENQAGDSLTDVKNFVMGAAVISASGGYVDKFLNRES